MLHFISKQATQITCVTETRNMRLMYVLAETDDQSKLHFVRELLNVGTLSDYQWSNDRVFALTFSFSSSFIIGFSKFHHTVLQLVDLI